MVKNYDPAQVICTTDTYEITGYAEGSFVTIERNVDLYAVYVGANGEGARSKSNNKSGRITIRLAQTSTSNEVLSDYHVLDEAGNAGTFAFAVRDNNGNSKFFAESAWVVKAPSAEYSDKVGEREWVIETTNLVAYAGGTAS